MADVPKLKFEDLDGKEKERGRLYLFHVPPSH